MQGKHHQRHPIGDQIAPGVVGQLMRQRERLLLAIITLPEIAREGDIFAPDAERQRPGCGIGFDHPDAVEHGRFGLAHN